MTLLERDKKEDEKGSSGVSRLTGFLYEPTVSCLVVGSSNVPRVHPPCLVNIQLCVVNNLAMTSRLALMVVHSTIDLECVVELKRPGIPFYHSY